MERKDQKDPPFLRKKYYIGEETRKVDYSYISAVGNLNLNSAKPYLAIAFECGEFEIATCLAEVTAYTKYLYIPDDQKRITLAEETDNPNIQFCLAEDKNNEVLKSLITNPNLPKIFAEKFALFGIISTTIFDIQSNSREVLIEEIWKNPKSNPNILVNFLKNQLIDENNKILGESDFSHKVFENELFTPEFLDSLYQSYSPNVWDYIKRDSAADSQDIEKLERRRIIQFVALHPKTPSKTIAEVIDRIDFVNPKKYEIDLLKIVIQNQNTSTEDLNRIKSEIENLDNASFNQNLVQELLKLFAKNRNSSAEILAGINPEKPETAIDLILNRNSYLNKTIESLDVVFEQYNSVNKSKQTEKELILEKITKEVAVDPKTPPEIIEKVIAFVIAQERDGVEGITPAESHIIQENPNLIIELNGSLKFLKHSETGLETIGLNQTYPEGIALQELKTITGLKLTPEKKLLHLMYDLKNHHTSSVQESGDKSIFVICEDFLKIIASRSDLTSAVLQNISFLFHFLEPKAVLCIKTELAKNKALAEVKDHQLRVFENYGAVTLENFYSEQSIRYENSKDIKAFENILIIAKNPACSGQLFKLLFELYARLSGERKHIFQKDLSLELAKSLLQNISLPSDLIAELPLQQFALEIASHPNTDPVILIKIMNLNNQYDQIITGRIANGVVYFPIAYKNNQTPEEVALPDYLEAQHQYIDWRVLNRMKAWESHEFEIDKYIHKRHTFFQKKFKNDSVLQGVVGNNYSQVMQIEGQLYPIAEFIKVLKIADQRKNPNPNLSIIRYEKDEILDLLNADNSDSILSLIIQIQNYLVSKSKSFSSALINQIANINPEHKKFQLLLEGLADMDISFVQDSGNFRLDFSWKDLSTKENSDRVISIDINTRLLEQNPARENELEKIKSDLKIVQGNLKDTLKKVQDADEKAKKEYEKKVSERTIAEIMTELEGGVQDEADRIFKELNAGDENHEMLVEDLLKKLEEGATVNVFELGDNVNTKPTKNSLSEADEFRQKLEQGNSENKKIPNAEFITAAEITNILKEFLAKEKENLENQSEETINKETLELANQVEFLKQLEGIYDKGGFMVVLVRQFTENHILNKYIQANLEFLDNPKMQPFLTLKKRIDKIYSAFITSKNTYQDKIKSTEDSLPKAFLFGGSDNNGKEQSGVLRYCQFLEIAYKDFLKTENIPQDLKQNIELGLYKIQVLLEVLQITLNS